MAGKGNPKGVGRPKGAAGKVTADIKAAFRKHGPELAKALIALTKSEDEDVRLKAITAALDRGYGKPAQAVTGEGGEGPVKLEIGWASSGG